MNRLLAILAITTATLLAQTAAAQDAFTNPNYDPNWNDALITHVGFGITFGLRWSGVGPPRIGKTPNQPANLHFFLGLEGTAGHSTGKDCGFWDTGEYFGAGLGLDYTFGAQIFSIATEARYHYLAGFFSPGVGLGPALELGSHTRWAVQISESLAMLYSRQRLGNGFTISGGMAMPFARTPIVTVRQNCLSYVEG